MACWYDITDHSGDLIYWNYKMFTNKKRHHIIKKYIRLVISRGRNTKCFSLSLWKCLRTSSCYVWPLNDLVARVSPSKACKKSKMLDVNCGTPWFLSCSVSWLGCYMPTCHAIFLMYCKPTNHLHYAAWTMTYCNVRCWGKEGDTLHHWVLENVVCVFEI